MRANRGEVLIETNVNGFTQEGEPLVVRLEGR